MVEDLLYSRGEQVRQPAFGNLSVEMIQGRRSSNDGSDGAHGSHVSEPRRCFGPGCYCSAASLTLWTLRSEAVDRKRAIPSVASPHSVTYRPGPACLPPMFPNLPKSSHNPEAPRQYCYSPASAIAGPASYTFEFMCSEASEKRSAGVMTLLAPRSDRVPGIHRS